MLSMNVARASQYGFGRYSVQACPLVASFSHPQTPAFVGTLQASARQHDYGGQCRRWGNLKLVPRSANRSVLVLNSVLCGKLAKLPPSYKYVDRSAAPSACKRPRRARHAFACDKKIPDDRGIVSKCTTSTVWRYSPRGFPSGIAHSEILVRLVVRCESVEVLVVRY